MSYRITFYCDNCSTWTSENTFNKNDRDLPCPTCNSDDTHVLNVERN